MTEAAEISNENYYDLEHSPSVYQLQDFLADISNKRRQLLTKKCKIRDHRKYVLLSKLMRKVATEHCRLQQLERRRIQQEMFTYVSATGIDCNRPPKTPPLGTSPVRVPLPPILNSDPGPSCKDDKSSWMKTACHRLRSIFRDIWSRIRKIMRQIQRLWKSDDWSNIDRSED